MKLYGLLGKTLSHSFSKRYFTEKFEKEGLKDHVYELFEIPRIEDFPALLENKPDLSGMNVTIPYKEQVMPYLDELDFSAEKVGAVNVIRFDKKGKRIGFNSDYYGFKQSLLNFSSRVNFNLSSAKALILGTGGASKAVVAALTDVGIPYKIVSREAGKTGLTYTMLTRDIIETHHLIVNSSPLGTYPKTDECPDIPYEYISTVHLLFDLVYNPEKTLFMQKGEAKGANVKNGLEMLQLQAEKAWEIWNKD